MNVGIIGIGVIGYSLKTELVRLGVKCLCYDILEDRRDTELDILINNSSCIFLTLPSTMTEQEIVGNGADIKQDIYDIASIRDVLVTLEKEAYPNAIIIRSTLAVGTTERLSTEYKGLNILHCPEFLSVLTASHDSRYPGDILIGRPSIYSISTVNYVRDVMLKWYPNNPVHVVDSGVSESVKLMLNSYYASKVTMFNLFREVCEKKGVNFEMVRHLMIGRGWIHPMHTASPGPDGSVGFGGVCLPKDLAALSSLMKQNDMDDCGLTSSILKYNSSIRDPKD